MKPTSVLIASFVLCLSACDGNSSSSATNTDKMTAKVIAAPVAKKEAYEMKLHGDTRIDNYYWMRDDARKDTEMLAHLAAENAYKKAVMEHTDSLQESLFEELRGRIKKDDSSVPYEKNGYWYYSQVAGDQEYAVYARRKGSMSAPEAVLLDGNKLAKGHEYFAIGGSSVSTNNEILAYSTDVVSRRFYIIEFKNITTGEMLPDTLINTSGQIVWANDNQTVFYVKKDKQTLLGYQVYRHKLGTEQSADVLMYEETDPTFYTNLGKTKDDNVIYIRHNQTIKTGGSLIDANKPEGEFTPFFKIEDNHEYAFDKAGGDYYIRTNWKAKNFRIMKVSMASTQDRSTWQDVIPARDGVLVKNFEIFENHLVVHEKENGENRLIVMNLTTGDKHQLKFDDPVFAANIGINPSMDSDMVRIRYSSLTTPQSVFDYDLESDERTLLKQDEVVGNFASSDYQSERIFIEARDGKKIPVSIVYRKDTFKKDGINPLYQYAYGSYGATMEPRFNSHALSLLDRGFVYAIAHIRGSQMLGREWYEDGKLYNKKNTFTDFIDVTKSLVDQGYGAKDKVFAVGGSAGGLLMGAVLNMAPEHYLAVGAHVPFVDVVTTMLDASIPLTTGEWDEWGNPAEKGYYDYMKSYSPYDNVATQDYPHILVTTGLHDSQVQYFEPAKWVAKLREHKTDNNKLVFEINMDGGHGGASGRFKRLKNRALEYAFFLDLIGIEE